MMYYFGGGWVCCAAAAAEMMRKGGEGGDCNDRAFAEKRADRTIEFIDDRPRPS